MSNIYYVLSIPVLSFPFHWTICLPLCQYYALLISVASYYILIPDTINPLALFFKIVLTFIDPMFPLKIFKPDCQFLYQSSWILI